MLQAAGNEIAQYSIIFACLLSLLMTDEQSRCLVTSAFRFPHVLLEFSHNAPGWVGSVRSAARRLPADTAVCLVRLLLWAAGWRSKELPKLSSGLTTIPPFVCHASKRIWFFNHGTVHPQDLGLSQSTPISQPPGGISRPITAAVASPGSSTPAFLTTVVLPRDPTLSASSSIPTLPASTLLRVYLLLLH